MRVYDLLKVRAHEGQDSFVAYDHTGSELFRPPHILHSIFGAFLGTSRWYLYFGYPAIRTPWDHRKQRPQSSSGHSNLVQDAFKFVIERNRLVR